MKLLILTFVFLGQGTGFRAAAFVQNPLSVRSFSIQSNASRASHQRNVDGASQQEALLKRTAAHLERLRQQHPRRESSGSADNCSDEKERLYQSYLRQSANSLKSELKARRLPRNGRKPDLAGRLAEYDLQKKNSMRFDGESGGGEELTVETPSWNSRDIANRHLQHFAGLTLSETAAAALGKAGFETPTPIQEAAIPPLTRGESVILHAETGSGKSLAYLLPMTERMWLESEGQMMENSGFFVVLTPTRELAAQVAGVASVLAPPGSVRLIARATNLLSDGLKERGEEPFGGRRDEDEDVHSFSRNSPRLLVGSAKAILHSLYGDGVMPASPTSKPEAMFFLRNVRCLVLDEVDRLLAVKKTRSDKKSRAHERPAAVVTAAVMRLTLGQAQVVAASATVGRPLKRELSRVLGLSYQECPDVVLAASVESRTQTTTEKRTTSRAVTIPPAVRHFLVPVDGSSVGKLLTSSFRVIQALSKQGKSDKRMLLVLTRGCGISIRHAIGALKHFKCRPEPISLLDALEAPGTDGMIRAHREVSGASGVGESMRVDVQREDEKEKGPGQLFVTGEDTVRGLHIDRLDTVLVVGRPHGPDEYTHIAGRTGRAQLPGNVINIISYDQVPALRSWETMLGVAFERLDLSHHIII